MIHITLALTEKTDWLYTMYVYTPMVVFTASNFKVISKLCLTLIGAQVNQDKKRRRLQL